MNREKPDTSIEALAAEVGELKTGLKWLLGIFLVVISLPNILSSFAIHHFDEIYQETLPGLSLPTLTSLFLSHAQIAQILSFAWPISGLILITFGRWIRLWALGGVFLIFAIGLQLALTEYAMITPLFAINPDTLR